MGCKPATDHQTSSFVRGQFCYLVGVDEILGSHGDETNLPIPLMQIGLNALLKITRINSLKLDLIQPDECDLGTSGLVAIHALQIAIVIPWPTRLSRIDIGSHFTT